MNWQSFLVGVGGDDLWRSIGWTMLHYFWTGALLWFLAALLRFAMRPFSPGARYAAALMSLALFAALGPACFFAVRAWPETFTLGAAYRTSGGSDPALELDPQWLARYRAMGEAAKNGDGRNGDRPLSLADSFAWLLESGERSLAIRVVPALPWVWSLGSAAVLGWYALGYAGAGRLRRSCDSLSDEEPGRLLARLRRELRIAREIGIGMSERIAAPLVVGVARPLILLPVSIVSNLSIEQLEFVLLHELAHVRRHDNLINLLQRIVEAAAFFHPAVWRLSSWVRLEREHCCDAEVLRRRAQPKTYAEVLASLAMPGLSAPCAVASLANHQLVVRVRHILKAEEPKMSISRVWLLGAAAVVLSSLGLMKGWGQAPAPAEAGVKATVEVKNDAIDRFVEGKFAINELKTDESIDRATLIRRLSLDLRGLPPTSEEVERFVADESPQAQRHLIERLLVAAQPQEETERPAKATSEANTVSSPRVELSFEGENVLTITAGETADYREVASAIKSVQGALQASGRKATIAIRSRPDAEATSATAGKSCVECHKVDSEEVGKHAALNEICATGLAAALQAAGEESRQAAIVHGDVLVTKSRLDAPREAGYELRATIDPSPANWDASQAAGAPNTFEIGDSRTAWASASEDDSSEWLELTFSEAVPVAGVIVHETYNPGAVVRVDAMGEGKVGAVLWAGEPKTIAADAPRLLFCRSRTIVTTNRVRLTIASDAVPGWNEIDAVGILDDSGRVHWAKEAKASSTYADRSAGQTLGWRTILDQSSPQNIVWAGADVGDRRAVLGMRFPDEAAAGAGSADATGAGSTSTATAETTAADTGPANTASESGERSADQLKKEYLDSTADTSSKLEALEREVRRLLERIEAVRGELNQSPANRSR